MEEFDRSSYWKRIEELRKVQLNLPSARVLEEMRRAMAAHRSMVDMHKIQMLERAARLIDPIGPSISEAIKNSIVDTPTVQGLIATSQLVESGISRFSTYLSTTMDQMRDVMRDIPFEALGRFAAALESQAKVLGIVELEPSEEESSEDTKSRERLLDLPDYAAERIQTVKFAPMRVAQALLKSPELLHDLTPRRFEEFTAFILEELGFESVELTPPSGDGGRDIIAAKTFCGIPMLFAIECKKYSPQNKIGPEIMRALLGTVQHAKTWAHKGVLVTTSTFTSGCRDFIVSEPRLDGKDFGDLMSWIGELWKQEKK